MTQRIACLTMVLASTSFASPAQAVDVLFQSVGVFAANAPTSSYTAPGQSYGFSFTLPNPPPGTVPGPGSFLTTALSNFSYNLNGTAVTTPVQYLAFVPGGFYFLFIDQVELVFAGPDIGGSGTITAPSSGLYQIFLDDNLAFAGTGFVVTSVVPEPASWAMLLAGLGLAGAVARRRSPAAA